MPSVKTAFMNSSENSNPFRKLTLSQIKELSSELLDKYFERFCQDAIVLSPEFTSFSKEMRDSLKNGNRKGFWFTYLGYVAAGGENLGEVQDFALAMELFNAALLLHDDVIDGDFQRNGSLNVMGIYRERFISEVGSDYGTKLAKDMGIIGGDTFYGLAYEKVLTSDLPETVKNKGLRYLLNANHTLCAGQQLDILGSGLSFGNINEEMLLRTNLLKNHWNIALPLVMGAYCADAAPKQVKELEDFAYKLGGAVQVANDIDLIYRVKFNSKTLGDLRERKKTLWLWYGWNMATNQERQFIESLLGNSSITLEDLKKLKELLDKYGARQKAYEKGSSLLAEAKVALRAADWISPHAAEQLNQYVAEVQARLTLENLSN